MVMAKKKPQSKDRHKGGRLVRVREQLRSIVEVNATDNARTWSEEINRLLVLGLRADGLWPPSRREA